MTARLSRLREERATAWAACLDIQARREADGYEPTAEDGETYTRALDDVERLSTEIETEERAERLANALAAPQPFATADPAARTASPTAFAEYLRRGNVAGLVEARAQATDPGTAGGYLVPAEFRASLIEELKAYGGLFALAEVITTNTGAPLTFPTADETGSKGVILAENTAAPEQDMTFGQFTIGAFTYTSKGVRISRQIVQDSAIDIETYVRTKLAERLGRAVAEHLAVGTGVGQPQGITKATKNVVTGAVTYDNLVDLEHSIDPAYRAAAQYVVNDGFVRSTRKLKDSQGRPLWVPAMAGGIPSTINGRPYTVDNDLDAAVFGDIKRAYLVRMVADVSVERSEHRYIEFGQVGYWGWQRLDARIQAQSAVGLLKAAA